MNQPLNFYFECHFNVDFLDIASDFLFIVSKFANKFLIFLIESNIRISVTNKTYQLTASVLLWYFTVGRWTIRAEVIDMNRNLYTYIKEFFIFHFCNFRI